MSERRRGEFTKLEGFALLLACIAIQLISEVMTQWGAYFYSPPKGAGSVVFVAINIAGTMFAITYVFSAIADPLWALWSDKTRTTPGRWRLFRIAGRRRPFIFWGSLGVTVTGILFWYPPVAGESWANFIYGTAILCIHWGVFSSMCTVPFNALAPEIARSDEARVRIGTWIAAGMILGLAIAEIAPGFLVSALDKPAPGLRIADCGLQIEEPRYPIADCGLGSGSFQWTLYDPSALCPRDSIIRNPQSEICDLQSAICNPQSAIKAVRTDVSITELDKGETLQASPVGFQRTAILFSIIALAFFQFCVWTVRERYQSTENSMATPPFRVVKQMLSNSVFLRYVAIFFLFNLGYLAVQRVLPYWVRVGLHGNTTTVSYLMLPYIGFALLALAFTNSLSKYLPIKWLIFISLAIMTTGVPMTYFIAIAPIGDLAKCYLGAALFSYCGIGQGMQYVLLTPMIGQIIDLDERRSGERREAIYQSVSGLAWKGSQALSVYVATMTMTAFGNSIDHPLGIYLVGPIAGVFGLLGLAICWTYPVLHADNRAE